MTDWAQYAREVQACSDFSYRHQEKIIAGLRAEITQLRAELEQERELADRMYGALEYIDDYCLAYPDLESISAVSSSAIEYIDTRRNK